MTVAFRPPSWKTTKNAHIYSVGIITNQILMLKTREMNMKNLISFGCFRHWFYTHLTTYHSVLKVHFMSKKSYFATLTQWTKIIMDELHWFNGQRWLWMNFIDSMDKDNYGWTSLIQWTRIIHWFNGQG